MSKLNCNVVRDILPLYADEVVCADTRVLMEEHLDGCESCRRELAAMRIPLTLPIQTDASEGMKKIKKKWGKKQLWKGIGITLAISAILVGTFFYLYGYGLPVKYEDLIIRTGFQCVGRDEVTGEWNEEFPTEDQTWILDMDTTYGSYRDTSKFDYTGLVIDGVEVPTGVTIYARCTPFDMPWDGSGKCRSGYGWDDALEMPEDYDFTVTIVCADRTVSYSLREEGLWDRVEEHTAEFCPFCVN